MIEGSRLRAFVAAAAIALALPVAGSATTPREDDALGDAPEVATVYSHPGAPAALLARAPARDAFARVLGVRSVRAVRSESPSQAAPNSPNAPNAHHANGSPLPSDEMFPLFIAEAGNAGHITADEFSELYAHHKLVERAREARPT